MMIVFVVVRSIRYHPVPPPHRRRKNPQLGMMGADCRTFRAGIGGEHAMTQPVGRSALQLQRDKDNDACARWKLLPDRGRIANRLQHRVELFAFKGGHRFAAALIQNFDPPQF